MAMNQATQFQDASSVFAPGCGASYPEEVNPVQAFIDLSKFSKDVKSKLAAFDDTSSSFRQTIVRLEETLQQQTFNIQTLEMQFQDRMNDVEQSLLKNLSATMDDISSQFQSIQKSLDVRESIKQIENVIGCLRTDMASFVEREQSSAAMMQQLKDEMAQMKTQMLSTQKCMEQKADILEVRQLDSEVSRVRARASDLEVTLGCKADVQAFDQAMLTLTATSEGQLATKSTVEAVSTQVQNIQVQLQEKAGTANMDDLFGKMGLRVQSMEDALGSDGLRPLQVDIGKVQDRIGSIEQTLGNKADSGLVHVMESNLANIRAHASGIESSLLETFGDLQSQLTEMQRSVSSKMSTKELQPLQVQLQKLQCSIKAVEQVTSEKVERTQMRQLEGNMTSIRTQIAGIESLLIDKVGSELNSKFSDLEHSLEQKVDKVQVRQELSSLNVKLSALESSSNSKVDQELLDLSLAAVEAKANTLERALEKKAESALVDKLDEAVDALKNDADNSLQSKIAKFDQVSRTLSLKVATEATRTKEALEAFEAKLDSIADCKASMSKLQENLKRKADVDIVGQQIGAVTKDFETRLSNNAEELINLTMAPICPPGTAVENIPHSPAPCRSMAALKRMRTTPTATSRSAPVTPGQQPSDSVLTPGRPAGRSRSLLPQKRIAPSTPGQADDQEQRSTLLERLSTRTPGRADNRQQPSALLETLSARAVRESRSDLVTPVRSRRRGSSASTLDSWMH